MPQVFVHILEAAFGRKKFGTEEVTKGGGKEERTGTLPELLHPMKACIKVVMN